jgi:hypothetical protein
MRDDSTVGGRARPVKQQVQRCHAIRLAIDGLGPNVELTTKRSLTTDEALAIATELGIDFGALGCDLEQFRMGLGVEFEHGPRDPETDVSGNDPIVTNRSATTRGPVEDLRRLPAGCHR